MEKYQDGVRVKNFYSLSLIQIRRNIVHYRNDELFRFWLAVANARRYRNSEVENRLSSVLDRLGNAIASGKEPPEKQGAPSVSTLRTEKDEVFEILAKWKNNAVSRGQEQARKDCEKIIKFLRTVCP